MWIPFIQQILGHLSSTDATPLCALHSRHHPRKPSESSEQSRGGTCMLNAKLDTDSLLYSLSHFECDGHTVHRLPQQCLLPPLTSTVKSSLFTHVHSSPLSSAARLHRCHANCSHYINNGWTFSGHTSYILPTWGEV